MGRDDWNAQTYPQIVWISGNPLIARWLRHEDVKRGSFRVQAADADQALRRTR